VQAVSETAATNSTAVTKPGDSLILDIFAPSFHPRTSRTSSAQGSSDSWSLRFTLRPPAVVQHFCGPLELTGPLSTEGVVCSRLQSPLATLPAQTCSTPLSGAAQPAIRARNAAKHNLDRARVAGSRRHLANGRPANKKRRRAGGTSGLGQASLGPVTRGFAGGGVAAWLPILCTNTKPDHTWL
jgi:hypothetical protein